MSGLDKIAMAVAHLEKMETDSDEGKNQKDQKGTQKTTKADSEAADASKDDEKPSSSSNIEEVQVNTPEESTDVSPANETAAAAANPTNDANPTGSNTTSDTNQKQDDVSPGAGEIAAEVVAAESVAPVDPTTASPAIPAAMTGPKLLIPQPKSSIPPSARGQWGMSTVTFPGVAMGPGRTVKRRSSESNSATIRQNSEPLDPAVAKLLTEIAMVTDDLNTFFWYMDKLIKLVEVKDTPTRTETNGIFHEVSRSDVLAGRGGETNHHAGNIQYRQLVKACQPAYLAAKRRDKPRIATKIVDVVRAKQGKFLKRQSGDNAWADIGNTRAREKTSQALREGAPELRGIVQNNGKSRKAPVAVPVMAPHPGMGQTVYAVPLQTIPMVMTPNGLVPAHTAAPGDTIVPTVMVQAPGQQAYFGSGIPTAPPPPAVKTEDGTEQPPAKKARTEEATDETKDGATHGFSIPAVSQPPAPPSPAVTAQE